MTRKLDRVGLLGFRLRVSSCALVAIAVLASFGLGAGVARAGSAFRESAASTTVPIGGQFPWINATACGSTDCVSVGSYEDSSSDWDALVIPSTSGIPGGGVGVQLPPGSDPGIDSPGLQAASCWSAGSCVAVGTYVDGNNNNQALMVPITNGSVGTAVEVPSPGGAGGSLVSVSCSSTGMCVAVGSYVDASGNSLPLVVPIIDGTAGNAVSGPLPSGGMDGPNVGFTSVSCTSSGSCTAVGAYTSSSGPTLPFSESVTNGDATSPQAVQLPSNADTSFPNAGLDQVSCWAPGACAAVGFYLNNVAADNGDILAVAIVNGQPQRAVEVSLPPGSDLSQDVSQLGTVSCESNGSCLAVGSYFDSFDNQYALVAPIRNGVVGAGAGPSMPANVAPNLGTSSTSASLTAVSCPPAGACLATGQYLDTAGNTDGLNVSFSGGTVGPGLRAPSPANDSVAPRDAPVAVGCGASGSCLVAGIEQNQANLSAPYVINAEPPLAIETTTLPTATVGVPYRKTLYAAGPWGQYIWTLASGNLLRGLSLNRQTGVLSGTPKLPGTTKFSVEATGGTPLQTATQSLSLTAKAAAKLKLESKSVVVFKDRVSLRLGCSFAACAGTARLEIAESVKHGKKRAHKHLTAVIGSRHFSIARGRTGTVILSLDEPGRRALASHDPLSAELFATVTGVKETVGHVRLRAAIVKHKRKS